MKYIDSDKLIAEIERRREKCADIAADERNEEVAEYYRGKEVALDEISSLIDSLQQEQSEDSKGKFVFPKFLYARTRDNKTIDMSYAPQDMTAVEYIRNDFVEQEQPEVDLEKVIEWEWVHREKQEVDLIECAEMDKEEFARFARHFYELGLKARKED